jgi:hypothetical protein
MAERLPADAERRASDPANAALGSQHLLVVVDRVDHHDLEEILEVAGEELHQRLTQLWTRIARPRLERGDVVLGHPETAGKLTLGQMMLVAHRPQADGPHLDIHTDKYTHL